MSRQNNWPAGESLRDLDTRRDTERFSGIAKDLRRAADKVDEMAGPASEIPHMPPSDTGPLRDDLRDLAGKVQEIGGRILSEAGRKGRETEEQ